MLFLFFFKKKVEWNIYRIHIPNHHSGIFGSGCKFSAVGRETTEPNFITVIVENLPCLQWKLIPEKWAKKKISFFLSWNWINTNTIRQISLGAQVITQQRDVVKRGIRFQIMIGAPLLLWIHGLRQQSVKSKSIDEEALI